MLMAQEDFQERFITAHPPVRSKIVWHKRPAFQRRVRLVARLLSMGPGEVAHRALRLVKKRSRSAVSARADATAEWPKEMLADPSGYLSSRSNVGGFFEPRSSKRIAEAAREQLPTLVASTISEAESILADGIELLGQRFRPVDEDFDWHADPALGRLWPMSKMDDSDAVRGVDADVKFVWEVNRHQYLATLARAHVYSGDDRFARACVGTVLRWIESNPREVGVNWSSNLEVAMRALSWVWSLHFLAGANVGSAADFKTWLESLREHRDHLHANLSVYTDPTNHLIGEACALAVVSLWFPEWPRSGEYADAAITILQREILHQVEADGISKEQATSYQRFVLDLVLQAMVMAERNGKPFDPAVKARVGAMLEAARALAGAHLRAPRIGDSDDARGVPFFCKDHWSFEDLLAVGSSVLPTVGIGISVEGDCECALWLRGGEPPRAKRPNEASPKQSASCSRIFESGGYAILSNRGAVESRLVFDCGPLGYLPHASHGHADLLSVLVDVGGHEMLVDPGSYAYYDENGFRDQFRSTRFHNTIEIGGVSQADAFDPFKWLNIPRQSLQTSYLGGTIDYVEAWHDGYRRLVPGVRHRRAVVGFHGGWLIVDWLDGTGKQTWTRWFHGAVDTMLDKVDGTAARFHNGAGGCGLLVKDVSPSIGAGADAVETGAMPYSERYGRSTHAPAVRFVDDDTALPAVRLTLLIPEAAETGSAGLYVAAVDHTDSVDRLELECERGGRLEVVVRAGAGEGARGVAANEEARFELNARTADGAKFEFMSSSDHVEFRDAQ